MERFEEWSNDWKEILLCTKYWDYNGECSVEYKTSSLFKYFGHYEQWISLPYHFRIEHRADPILPTCQDMYEFGDKVVFRFEDGGHWFVFSDGQIHFSVWIESDAYTHTKCTLRECFSLYDLVWTALTDSEREKLGINDKFESFSQFRRSITKTQLKKKLFRSS
ncbi:hypothetical protein GMAR_ORF192 [Golden Marseillevirus]|uniref:hypothetical protein n=1 Tax=Golden Marseillevirus TaxID=1720526 RepID=UPI000877A9E3|nr:hypothetical protein GMAR_ORF192 [Golden Marseillevirus]ALX27566.1 hypothetical protein GMAR_ORF192 [Golden Marseillevirus]